MALEAKKQEESKLPEVSSVNRRDSPIFQCTGKCGPIDNDSLGWKISVLVQGKT